MSFFSLDSKFSQIMGRVFDLMMLNIIFLIMCIPIVTIGRQLSTKRRLTVTKSAIFSLIRITRLSVLKTVLINPVSLCDIPSPF